MLRIGSFTAAVAATCFVMAGCPDINVVDNNTQDGSVSDIGGSDADGSSETGGDTTECKFGNDAPCDDDNPCTTDKCSLAGKCEYSEAENVCNVGGTCVDAGTIKDDNECLVCNPTADANGWSDVDCDDGNACTADDCDFKTGCEHTNDDTATCDDGQACSTDDHCDAGSCVGTCDPPECEVAGDCEGDPGQCNAFECQSGTCVAVADTDANGATCDDGDPCTESDVCTDGACGGTDKDCSTDGSNPCVTGVCNASTGACETEPTDDGTTCGDPGQCTEMVCSAGSCVEEIQAGQDCDTGNACLEGETCQDDGTCGGGTNSCTCTVDGDCDDGLSCTANTCGADGLCTFPLIPGGCLIGGACYSAGQAVGGDACQVCQPSSSTSAASPLSCDDNNPCTADSCDPSSGCVNAPDPTATCDDGDACTTGDACDAAGNCTGTVNTCDDSNPCTEDSCNAATGGCDHLFQPNVPCDDGDACTSNTYCQTGAGCVGQPTVCDDGSECTTDSCDPVDGCVFEPLPTGSACKEGDPCILGSCQADGSCAIEVAPACIVPGDFGTPFPCGTAEFTLANLNETGWAVDGAPDPPGFYSQSCSLNFNDPNAPATTPSYGTADEQRTGGTATTPWIQGEDQVLVTFRQYWDTQEFPLPYDRRGMRVSTDGFVTYKEYSVGHRQNNPSNQSQWFRQTIDLSKDFAGQLFQIQFWFDTIDGVANQGPGWFIDDFQVIPGSSPFLEVCGDQVDNDEDALVDCQDPDCKPTCFPDGGSCWQPATLPPDVPLSIIGSTAGLGDAHSQPMHPNFGGGQGAGGSDAVYVFQPTTEATYVFTLTSADGWETWMYATTGCDDLSDTLAALTVEKPDAATALMYLHAVPGTTYYIVVDSILAGVEGDFELTVDIGGEQDCKDGADDDGNGAVDCGDQTCQSALQCVPEDKCGDGVDNDGNGLADCADPACQPFPAWCPNAFP